MYAERVRDYLAHHVSQFQVPARSSELRVVIMALRHVVGGPSLYVICVRKVDIFSVS